jgi:hypothetical protein
MVVIIFFLYKSGDKSNPFNYKTIMISLILAKLYVSVLEKKIDTWLENHGKRARDLAGFRGYHSTLDHLVTLRIIA